MKTITYRQFDGTIKRAVNKRLDEVGRSPSEATVENHIKAVITSYPVDKKLDVVDDWEERIKKAVRSINA